MVKDLYCPEQIQIPEQFPQILKDFVKSAIRTQPYDLLRWSAEYFRSLANNEPPMVKIRYEKDTVKGGLTFGYLRVLLNNVGKGFFINRFVLINKWRAITLDEVDLHKFLSLCRMLKWAQVHWLKLLAVLAGSLNNNLMDTMTMLCNLLTDDVEGGPARIPIWIFVTMYEYLANLDCSEEQKFIDGRKVLLNGNLENEKNIDQLPYVLSTTSIKRAIIEQLNEVKPKAKKKGSVMNTMSRSEIDFRGFVVHGKEENVNLCLKKLENFNTLIFYIKEHQNRPALEDYEGPHSITNHVIKQAHIHEQQLIANRELKELGYAQNVNEKIYQNQVNMLEDLGPPWSWIYQFTSENCIEKSYNLMELESLESDVTPQQSSDESFDYITQKALGLDEDESIASSVDTLNTIEEFDAIKKTLLAPKEEMRGIHSTHLEEIEEVLKNAYDQGQLELENSSSVCSVLCKEEIRILENAGEQNKPPGYDIKIIINIFKEIENEPMPFTTIDEIMEFIVENYNKVTDKFLNNGEPDDIDIKTSTTDYDVSDEENISTPIELVVENFGAGDFGAVSEVEKKCLEQKEKTINIENVEAKPPAPPRQRMENAFEDSGITPDANLLAAPMQKEMILGLVDPPEKPPPADVPETSSEISLGDNIHSLKGYISDDSSIFFLNKEEKIVKYVACRAEDSEESVCPPEQISIKCTIPILPGIGPKVKDKTIEEFLQYMKFAAMRTQGLVSPSTFKDEKCPAMIDC